MWITIHVSIIWYFFKKTIGIRSRCTSDHHDDTSIWCFAQIISVQIRSERNKQTRKKISVFGRYAREANSAKAPHVHDYVAKQTGTGTKSHSREKSNRLLSVVSKQTTNNKQQSSKDDANALLCPSPNSTPSPPAMNRT
jgi:hypothetical protein